MGKKQSKKLQLWAQIDELKALPVDYASELIAEEIEELLWQVRMEYDRARSTNARVVCANTLSMDGSVHMNGVQAAKCPRFH